MAFIQIDDGRWEALLKVAVHDLYHLPVFTKIEAVLLQGEACAWYCERNDTKVLIPLVKRRIGESGFFDLVSPYGYPGVLSDGKLDEEQAVFFLELFHKEASEAGYVSSFVRLNPFFNDWKLNDKGFSIPFLRQWYHGGTVSVELERPLDAIKCTYTLNHRRNLKRLKEKGYSVKVNNWPDFKAFMTSYYETMERKEAHPYYFFPSWYFDQLKERLADHLVFIAVYDAAGGFCAGGLFTRFFDVMQFHLGATNDDCLYHSPSKLMMDEAINYAYSLNLKYLHLGGGLGGSVSDGLFRFKKGFGQQYHAYSTLRFVHNKKLYHQLKNTKGSRLQYIEPSFFPAYRIT